MSRKLKHLHVLLDDDMYEYVREQSHNVRISKSQFIRMMIEYFQKHFKEETNE